MEVQLHKAGGRLATSLMKGGGKLTTYEAMSMALQSNLVVLGVITIVVMLFVANKKK